VLITDFQTKRATPSTRKQASLTEFLRQFQERKKELDQEEMQPFDEEEAGQRYEPFEFTQNSLQCFYPK